MLPLLAVGVRFGLRADSIMRAVSLVVGDLFAPRRNIDGQHREHPAFPEHVHHLVFLASWAAQDPDNLSGRNRDPTLSDNRVKREGGPGQLESFVAEHGTPLLPEEKSLR